MLLYACGRCGRQDGHNHREQNYRLMSRTEQLKLKAHIGEVESRPESTWTGQASAPEGWPDVPGSVEVMRKNRNCLRYSAGRW